MTKVTITLQDDEFIARHSDHVGIIGVGDTEQEALGALAFRVNKKDELLGLYRQYYNKIPIGTSMYKVELEIARLEKELKEGSK